MSGIVIAITVVAVLIIIAILLQQRSAGLGGAFGSDTTVFTSRRGAEKTLFQLTIILAVILVTLSLLQLWITRPKTTTSNTATPTASTSTPATDTTATPAATTDTTPAAPASTPAAATGSTPTVPAPGTNK